ncbi:MAG TPA: PIN domain-containing protein [Anaerolineae bacterium]|nr:PIN domain-containing protein [Anaerolineae bacterium]
MLKIYFDTCSLQRPLDSKTQIRIILEAEAVLNLLGRCEAGGMVLIGSDILLFETERNPNLTRREYATEILRKAKHWVALNEFIENRARVLNKLAFKPLDALHLASAEAAGVDYFCTCDDRLLKRARSLKDLQIPVLSPLDLIGEIEK